VSSSFLKLTVEHLTEVGDLEELLLVNWERCMERSPTSLAFETYALKKLRAAPLLDAVAALNAGILSKNDCTT
jgi:hypothetical protein